MLLRPGFSACHDRFFSGAGPAVSVAIGQFRKSFIVIVSQMFPILLEYLPTFTPKMAQFCR